jgi:two-component system, LuxR family, response regulator FixJ
MVESAQSVAPRKANVVRILDDDVQVLDSLAGVIRSLGYEVRAFDDPIAFLSDGREECPSCLIVDWQLPGDDGLEVIGRCKQQWPLAPAILISGQVTVAATVAAMRRGVAGVIQKPVSREELSHEIEVVLSRARSRTSAAEERAEARCRVGDLSELELSILKLLVEGTPNKNIAIQTGLAVRTVEKYRRIVFDKLGVDSAAEATRVWVLATIEE